MATFKARKLFSKKLKNPSDDVGIASIIIEEYDELTNPAVTLFEHPLCRGASAAFFAGGPGNEASYNKSKLENGKTWNDMVSAVMVPFNVVLTLYDEDGFRGAT